MRPLLALVVLVELAGSAAAAVPLPRPRPVLAPGTQIQREVPRPPRPTDCDERLAAMAGFAPRPDLVGPGACGGSDMVEVKTVLLPGKRKVTVQPTALLNCPMAESLVSWVREEVAPRIVKFGGVLRSVENYDSYQCRTRNGVPGAKLSEHAKGDAIDLHAFMLTDGRRLVLTDPKLDRTLSLGLRDSACHRFATVLGPGADSYHRTHVHLDALVRSSGYRICQWEVGELAPSEPSAPQTQAVPLPRPRPSRPSTPFRR